MWIARLLTYLAGAIGGAVVIFGYGTFNPATGALDLAPVNVYALAATVGNLLAAFAVARGWAKK